MIEPTLKNFEQLAKLINAQEKMIKEWQNYNIESQKKNKTLRDEIAIAAMQGIITTSAAPFFFKDGIDDVLAEHAYAIADVMLKAREKGNITTEAMPRNGE